MAFLFITFFLLLLYVSLLLYYRKSWIEIKNYIPKKITDPIELPFVSIIIAARNEEKNIGDCIESILAQTYSERNFEVIVVNDHSTDETAQVVNSFHEENIRLINLEDFIQTKSLNSYKKKSIETALQFAKGELIVTTDADCIAPAKWLETLVSFYLEKNPIFVCLPVRYIEPSADTHFLKKFLIRFQCLDFLTLQGISGASVYKKFHGMCNGANLAYEKKVFYEVNGFEGIDELASGDDMLLMHKIQKLHPEKVMYLKSPEVIVDTKAAASVHDFLNQRIRWASKADSYTDKKITAVLLLVYFFNAWILVLAIAAFFFENAFVLLLISLVSKTFFELFFLFPVAKFFKQQKLLLWFIPAEPFHVLYTIIAGWLGRFGSYKWKGRKVK
jgi:cellulose synthase/poly-beta-1,6-N-acetylglucosamine synthase-like glycosyltransferase